MHQNEDEPEDEASLTEDQIIARIDATKRYDRLMTRLDAMRDRALAGSSERERELLEKLRRKREGE
jgi:hypothetical protein